MPGSKGSSVCDAPTNLDLIVYSALSVMRLRALIVYSALSVMRLRETERKRLPPLAPL